MATTGIDICSPYGMACTECNDLVVAPKWSAYASKREVRHIWSCENCGHEIEMTVNTVLAPDRNPARALNGRSSGEQSRSEGVRYVKGQPHVRYERMRGRRAEALDCVVYGWAARSAIPVNYDQREMTLRSADRSKSFAQLARQVAEVNMGATMFFNRTIRIQSVMAGPD